MSKRSLCDCEGQLHPIAFFEAEGKARNDMFLVVKCENCEAVFAIEDSPITWI